MLLSRNLRGQDLVVIPNTLCHMGASSSPDVVILLSDNGLYIEYLCGYGMDKVTRIDSRMGRDLIFSGTTRWCATYGEYHSATAADLKAWLAGGEPVVVDPEDFHLVTIIALVADPHPTAEGKDASGVDLWRTAEEYGNVGMCNGAFEIDSDRARAREIAKDSRFKVVSVKDRKSSF